MKHKHFFSLSFIIYPYFLFCYDYFLNRLSRLTDGFSLSDLSVDLFKYISYIILMIIVIYQLSFIIKFRKNDAISLSNSIFMAFVRFFQSIGIGTLLYLITIFIFGYAVYSWALPYSNYIATYYGFDAWANNLFAIIIAPPLLIIATLLTVIWKFKERTN
ncbi:MAG: hypothetical protein CR995_00675 [Clostridiales bacterium]|nr:MAG: hypothetical protein CR995_00675 [Clostridiales bacterium]